MILYILLIGLCMNIQVSFSTNIFIKMNQYEFNRNDYILKMAEEFQIQNPYIVGDIKEQIKLFKTFSKNGHHTGMCKNIRELSRKQDMIQTALIFHDETRDITENLQQFLNIHQTAIILVLQEEQFQKIYSMLKIEIHQAIYFLEYNSKQMYESYTINNFHVKRQLGQCFTIINYSINSCAKF